MITDGVAPLAESKIIGHDKPDYHGYVFDYNKGLPMLTHRESRFLTAKKLYYLRWIIQPCCWRRARSPAPLLPLSSWEQASFRKDA